jgi:AcrR family transcriptional regulator
VKEARKVDGRVLRAERKRKERRAKVLAAASSVFAEKGYHASSIADIIEAAGIARGTFYLYFESKREIFDELLDSLIDHLRREVRTVDVGAGARPPREQLQAIVRHVLATLVTNRDLTRILLREAVGIDDDFDRKLHAFYERILDLIRSALETGQRLGLVRPCDLQVTAWCVLGSVKELADHALLGPSAPRELDLDAITRTILDFNLNGVFQGR